MSDLTPTNKDSLKTMSLRQVPHVQGLLINDKAREQLAAVAARHMNPERLMRVVANAIRTTPGLLEADPMSFLGALMQCAALGLEPNTVLGHAYLIPFENNRKAPDGTWRKTKEVQLVVGYKGLIDLARRSGHITSITADIHYSDDQLWEFEQGTQARLRHIPGPPIPPNAPDDFIPERKGRKLDAYAIAQFKDGGHAYVVLPWSEVIKIRNGSQGWQSAVRLGKTDKSPWKTHEDAMAKKTAIRALAKYLPLSVDFVDAIATDESRADYRAYAMDPTAGLTIDGEVVPDEEEPQPEPKPKPDHDTSFAENQNRAPAEPEKAKAAPKPKADKKPEPEPSLDLEPEKKPEPEPDWSQNGFAKGVTRDIADIGPDGAWDLHGGEIESFKDSKPGLYAYLIDKFEQAKAAEEAGD